MARMNVLADVVRGLKANIYAVDNLSPVSRVAVYIKAGSRYEPDDAPGITHYIKASAGLTTQKSSVFGFARHMERAGATFTVSVDREYIIYRISCLRNNLSYLLGFVDDTIHRPEFRPWELEDYVKGRLRVDLEMYKKNQQLVANEAMHKVAYRGGLAHPVFAPEHQIGKISRSQLLDFVEKNFVLERMSFVGLGVDPNDLRQNIDDGFHLNGSPYGGIGCKARYVSGEARVQADFPHTMVNYVVNGCHINDLKGLAVLEVISSTLVGPTHHNTMYLGSPEKKLSSVLKTFSSNFKAHMININYTDNGLFGFSIVGPNKVLRDATKVAIQHVKKIMSDFNEEDLAVAKRIAKARSLIASENQDAMFNAMGHRFAAGVPDKSPLDLVDSLTLKDVQTVVGHLLKSKPTMVSIGNPRFVPYIDRIDS